MLFAVIRHHTNCNVICVSVCELTWNFLQTMSTEMKQGLPAEQNECRFCFIIKHTMTDPLYKIQSLACSSVTTWNANAAVFVAYCADDTDTIICCAVLMILTLSFAVHVEPMILLEKSTVQHCYHLSHVFCSCS
jgi:hypothetical protein